MNNLTGKLAQRWAEITKAMGAHIHGNEPVSPKPADSSEKSFNKSLKNFNKDMEAAAPLSLAPKNLAEKEFNARMKATAQIMQLKMTAEDLVQDIEAFAALKNDDRATARALLRRVEALEGKLTYITIENLKCLIAAAHKNK